MTPKISLIVPIYNSSKYLKKCLESIINQSLLELEIILVNNGSTHTKDEEICLSFMSGDNRIIYIKLGHNLRAGGARNVGIKISKAKYISFIDSDDTIENDYCKILFNNAVKNNSDLVIALANKIYENKNAGAHPSFYFIRKMITQEKDNIICKHPHCWGKLYKKSLFIDNNILFPENMHYEDVAITPSLIYYSKTISFAENAIYYYHYRDASSMRGISKMHIDSVFCVVDMLKCFLFSLQKENKKRITEEYYSAFFLHILQVTVKNIYSLSGESLKENIEYFLEKLNENVNMKELSKVLKISKLKIGGEITLSPDSKAMKYFK